MVYLPILLGDSNNDSNNNNSIMPCDLICLGNFSENTRNLFLFFFSILHFSMTINSIRS